MLKFTFLILLVLVVCRHSSAKCKQSFQTICDSIADYEKFNDGTWTDVVIKPDPRITVKKVPFNVKKFRNLNSVTLISQIDELGDSENTCVYDVKLRSLNFYANSIKSIQAGNFLRFLDLHKLGLVNNGIKTLHKRAFSLPKIEVIDLSDNEIEKIYSGTFTNELAKFRTTPRKIFLRNNKLSNIEPHSFPRTLEMLKLDNNNLTILREGVIDDLPYLQGLYLSKNHLTVLPNVTALYNLRVLDMSFNKIRTISRTAFSKLLYLTILDLSHNKIASLGFLNSRLLHHNRMDIFLNFNLVQSLDGLDVNGTVSDKVLNLFGNPLLCDEWSSVKNGLEKINLKMSKCDEEAFNNGNISSCMSSYSKPLEEYVEEFYDEVTGKGHLLKCDYVSKTYGDLFYKNSIDIRCIGG